MKKILIATDGSPSALRALDLGLELAEEDGARPVLVHVAPTSEFLPVSGFAMGPVAVQHELDETDQAPLDEASRMADERGLESEVRLLSGNPAKEIAAYADSIDADLIVLGSHGYGAISSILLGSVSRGVLRLTNRPVLIVREVAQRVESMA